MLITEANTLIADYLRWLKENLRPEIIAENEAVISTPFLDRHNDEIEIYLQKTNEGFRLSDDAYTIRDLRGSGIEINQGTRKKHLERILNGFGVQLDGDELWVTASPTDFPQKKHNLTQAILAVDDLYVTARTHVVNFFREDVEALLKNNQISVFSDFKLPGKSGFDHHFDFGIPSSKTHPERILATVNTLRRDSVSVLAFSVQDVRELRELEAYAFINDQEQAPATEYLDALRRYKITPIIWSKRDEATIALAS